MKLVKLLVEEEEGWILQVQEDFLPNPEQEPDQKLFFAAGQDPEEGLAENILLCPDTSTWVFASVDLIKNINRSKLSLLFKQWVFITIVNAY